MPPKSIYDIKPYHYTMRAFLRAKRQPEGRQLSVITGIAGVGKSFCAGELVERQPGNVLVRVPVRELLTRPRSTLNPIAKALGAPYGPTTPTDKVASQIIARLRFRKGMLILDEADQLTTKHARMVRDISDRARKPVCFLGTPAVEEVLKRDDTLWSRVGYRYHIHPVSVADLRKVFPRMFPAEAYDEIIAVTGGNLRSVLALWAHLVRFKRRHGFHAVTGEVVRAIAADRLLLNAE